MTTHLKQRGGTYYAQLRVPVDLASALGSGPIERSLRTKNKAEAKVKLLDVLKEWHSLFAAARRGEAPVKKGAASPSIVAVAKAHYRRELEAADRERGIDPEGELRRLTRPLFVKKLRLVKAGLIDGEEAESLIGYAAPEAPPAVSRDELLRKMAEVQLDALAVAEAHDAGRAHMPEPKSELLLAPDAETVPEGEGILDLFDRYARENQRGVSKDTLTQARRDVALFSETAGNIPARSIRRKHVAEWKDLLMLFPVKAAESKAFTGMTMREIVKANEAVGKPRITDRTVNRYLSALSAFCAWLKKRDYLPDNPAEGFQQEIDKTETEAVPFTVEQMNVLFAAPPFTGAKSDVEWKKPGEHRIRDHRFWTPLVMLFSGARPGEIAQLRVGDVRELHGHPVMHITTRDEEGKARKTVKTKGSVRVVPIHPELVKLGFLAYRDEIAATGEARLFPKATQGKRGQWVADFSKGFNQYLTTLKLKQGRGLNLYSFRHGFADALRNAGFMDEQFRFLLGHTTFTMTARYGQVPEGTLQQRVAMIEAVAYPGLKLNQLYPQE